MNAVSSNNSEFWEPRRTLTLDAARNHSRFIRILRWVFAVSAALLLGTALYLMTFGIEAPPPPETAGDAMKITNAQFNGTGDDGLPYKVIADEAIRQYASDDIVQLVAPKLNFFRNEMAEASILNSDVGTYDQANDILEVTQNVYLSTDDGYECRTEHARIFVDSGRVQGDEAIKCNGPAGEVTGNSFEIQDDYTRIVFKDGVTSYIIPADSRYKNTVEDDVATDTDEEPVEQ